MMYNIKDFSTTVLIFSRFNLSMKMLMETHKLAYQPTLIDLQLEKEKTIKKYFK